MVKLGTVIRLVKAPKAAPKVSSSKTAPVKKPSLAQKRKESVNRLNDLLKYIEE